jgi:hypothetical protein
VLATDSIGNYGHIRPEEVLPLFLLLNAPQLSIAAAEDFSIRVPLIGVLELSYHVAGWLDLAEDPAPFPVVLSSFSEPA